MIVLGIESSCDETAAAVLRDGHELLSNVIHTQIETHAPFGGVVPEIASRKHIENIAPVVQMALDEAAVSIAELDGIAVTRGPGLIGSLLVGLSFAKAMAYVAKIPYVGIDHMAAHLAAAIFCEPPPRFPAIALVVSGGHSNLYLLDSITEYRLIGRSRDDAAGEAFDKVAKILGLDYPGGPVVSRLAATGDPAAIAFPRAWLEPDSYDFSFSGIKTAVANYVAQLPPDELAHKVPDICASFQEAVVDVLCSKTIKAACDRGLVQIVAAGGVSANPRLRQRLLAECKAKGIALAIPAPEFCTDNAAMVAVAGTARLAMEGTTRLDMDVYSRSA